MPTIKDKDDDVGRVLTGSLGESNTIYGYGGADVIIGQGWLDKLYGGAGKDKFESGGGTDYIYGGADADTLEFRNYAWDTDYFEDFKASEGDRVDVRYLNIASLDTLKAMAGKDPGHDNDIFISWGRSAPSYVVLDGVKSIGALKTGMFIFDKDKTNDTLTLDKYDNFQAFGYGNDTVHGGKGNDVLFGEQGNDALYGDDGKDEIWGGAGNDKLYTDMYLGDFVDGGTGNDSMKFTVQTTLLDMKYVIDFEKGKITQGSSSTSFYNVESVILEAFIHTGEVSFKVLGSDGADDFTFRYKNYAPGIVSPAIISLYGSAGADTYDIGPGALATMHYDNKVKIYAGDPDKSTGDAKGDTVRGAYLDLSKYDDTYINTGRGNAVIFAGKGDDWLKGGSDMDSFHGGKGQDTMFGGRDKEMDRYEFFELDESTNKAPDRIIFEDGYDRIGIWAIDPNANSTKGQDWSVVENFTRKAGQVQWDHLLIKGDKQTWIELDVTGDARADMTIILDGYIEITKADFVL